MDMKKRLIFCSFSILLVLLTPRNSCLAQIVSPGDLSRAHEKLSGINNCTKCHALGKGIAGPACISCHEKLVRRIQSGDGLHARVSECIACHTEHKGRDAVITQIARETFDHGKTGFRIQGGHTGLSCERCHRPATYLGLSKACTGCHVDVHKRSEPGDCTHCHQTGSWTGVSYDHDKPARFSLSGKHRETPCESCHRRRRVSASAGGVEKTYNAPGFGPLKFKNCGDCHNRVHKAALKAAGCSSCHTPDGWGKTVFNHNNPELSDFPLTGKHETVSCKLCHPSVPALIETAGEKVKRAVLQLKPLRHGACSDCHYDVHKGQFAKQNCDSCHSLKDGWKNTTFAHNSAQYRGFKLTGKHEDVACDKCHERREITFVEFGKQKSKSIGTFTPRHTDTCYDCHYDVHKGQFAKQNCDSCHSVKDGWKRVTFTHESPRYDGFKLAGKHKDVQCEKCHERAEVTYVEFKKEKTVRAGIFKVLRTGTCSDCHKADHKGSFREIETVQGISCRDCHSVERKWKERRFKHKSENYTKYTRYDSTERSQCEQCHICSTEKFCISCCLVSMSNFGLPSGR